MSKLERPYLPKVGERVVAPGGETGTVYYGSLPAATGARYVPVNLDGREGTFWFEPLELRPVTRQTRFAKTIEWVEAQADELSAREPNHWVAARRRFWIVNRLIGMHHWQALEEYLEHHPDPPEHEEQAA